MQEEIMGMNKVVNLYTNQNFTINGSGTTQTFYSDIIDVSEFAGFSFNYKLTGASGTPTLGIYIMIEDAWGQWFSYQPYINVTTPTTGSYNAAIIPYRRFKIKYVLSGGANSTLTGFTFSIVKQAYKV